MGRFHSQRNLRPMKPDEAPALRLSDTIEVSARVLTERAFPGDLIQLGMGRK